MKAIQVSSPKLLGNERKYVLDALDRVELSWHGPYIERFEEAFAEFSQTGYAVACSSGTSALHLALLAMGVKEGDDVFLPALTYVATANAVRYVGANPVFCDVNRMTWTLETESVDEAIEASSRPVAILPVHLYGVPADMLNLQKLAASHDLYLLEDAAEAHGASVLGNRVGSLGDIGVFSFFANKLLTTGEGGMLTTNDSEFNRRARLYRGQGQSVGRQFYHEVIGYNYRMTNLQAAIGLAQLEKFDQHAEAHDNVVDIYKRELRGGDFEFQRALPASGFTSWLFTVLLPSHVDRDTVIRKMAKAGVETRPVFTPLNELPMYPSSKLLPNTAEIARRGISLPTHGDLSNTDVCRVVETLLKAVN